MRTSYMLLIDFSVQKPVTLNARPLVCRTTRITFDDGVAPGDWDDRLRTVKWVDVPPEPQGEPAPLPSDT